MSFLLPPTTALYSSWFNYYLNYSNDSDSQKYGFLKFNGENVFSSLAKFEVVTANTGTGVHIRCSHNKKFLRVRTEGDVNLSPEADEPEEDLSKWSCTLFEPQVAEDGNPDKARLFFVREKRYATAYDEGGVRFFRLYDDPHDQNIFDITYLESLVILPKHVAFKGYTGNYLQLVEEAKLRFRSTDKGISESWFEVSTDGHGRVQIKSYHDNSYFFNSSDRIWSDPKVAATDPSTLFWPVKVDSNTVALKSNNKFCAQISDANGTDALNAAYTSITTNSHFVLEELVLSRRIYNADFDLKNAIIYGETPVTMATANASNNTSAENTVEFKFEYKESKSSTWKASHSWMVSASVSASFKIPIIGGTDVTVSGEYTDSYEWGETITSENTLETTYKAIVPANTSISVSLMATKGTCDVPYSYYQKDVLYNGKTVVYKKDDGLYTGINSYNFRYETTARKEPISIADLLDPSVDPTTEQMLPDPSVDPTIEQMIPEPVPSGSTTRVQLEDAACSAAIKTLA